MVCSIGECFNELCRILTSTQGREAGKAKQLEKRSAHSRPVGHVFYLQHKITNEQYRRIPVLDSRVICTLSGTVG